MNKIRLEKHQLPEHFTKEEMNELNEWAKGYECEFYLESDYSALWFDEAKPTPQKSGMSSSMKCMLVIAGLVLIPVTITLLNKKRRRI